jgi:hypothetical protein
MLWRQPSSRCIGASTGPGSAIMRGVRWLIRAVGGGEPRSDNGGFRRRGAGRRSRPFIRTPLGRRGSAFAFDDFYNTQRSGI